MMPPYRFRHTVTEASDGAPAETPGQKCPPRSFEPRRTSALVAWPEVALGGGEVVRGDFIDRRAPGTVPGGGTAESIEHFDRCLRGTIVRSESGAIIFPPGHKAEVARHLACKMSQESGGWPSLTVAYGTDTVGSRWELRVKWDEREWPDRTLRAINQDDGGGRD